MEDAFDFLWIPMNVDVTQIDLHTRHPRDTFQLTPHEFKIIRAAALSAPFDSSVLNSSTTPSIRCTSTLLKPKESTRRSSALPRRRSDIASRRRAVNLIAFKGSIPWMTT